MKNSVRALHALIALTTMFGLSAQANQVIAPKQSLDRLEGIAARAHEQIQKFEAEIAQLQTQLAEVKKQSETLQTERNQFLANQKKATQVKSELAGLEKKNQRNLTDEEAALRREAEIKKQLEATLAEIERNHQIRTQNISNLRQNSGQVQSQLKQVEQEATKIATQLQKIQSDLGVVRRSEQSISSRLMKSEKSLGLWREDHEKAQTQMAEFKNLRGR